MKTRIEAASLIPGRGAPIEQGVVVLDGPLIEYAGSAADAPVTADAKVVTTETVMPGMWECHGHFMGIYGANMTEVLAMRTQVGAIRSTADARRALDAGFTSVREVGGYGVFLAQVIEEGQMPGPTIYASGGALSMTAGHGDFHSMPMDSFRRLDKFGEFSIVDGPDQARLGVRRMLRLGARVIKIHASGGVMSQLDDPHLPQFTKAELEAIVDEATRMERLVAAHCHGKRGIMAALEAGVKTIEHGTYLDEETAEAMKETGAILVPTRFIVDHLSKEGKKAGMPDYAIKKMEETAANHANAIALAIENDVRIAMGTDIWNTGTWGRNAEELALLVECGMTPLQAIEAATATGPETVGPQAPNSGQLMAGMDADVICVDGDPTADVGILSDATNVTHVFKAGELVKG